VTRGYALDFAKILFDEKTSYMVVLKLPKKRKRFICHNLGKVSFYIFGMGGNGRARSLCDGSIPESWLRNGNKMTVL
jgi:hypothetical protein